jgi:hypothetical protein
VVRTALDPVKGSVPAPILKRYWLEGNLKLLSKYVKNWRRLPEKFVASLSATKEYTVVEPFGPLYSLNVTPPIVGVATGDPELEMGPAPPRAASQTMISYWLEPVAVDEVNMS